MSTWGRSSPTESGADDGGLRLERVSGQPIGLRALAVGVSATLLVGLLLLKPWDHGPLEPSDTRPTNVAVVPSPTPSPSPSPSPAPTVDPMELAATHRQCQSPGDWRMVTAETTADIATRTMYAAYPSLSNGPTDASLSLSRLYAGSLRAVGVCVPRSEDRAVAAELARVVLWQINDDGSVRQIRNPVVIDRPLFLAGEAYWAPPDGEGAAWPTGRYVFEIQPSNGGPSRWMGVEYIHVAASGAAGVSLP